MPRTNPFQPIYDACNRGNSRDKLANLPDYPRYLDIELTNCCNFRCLMCPVGTEMIRRPQGLMSVATFRLIREAVAPRRLPVRFIRWGEPLLHPRFLDYVTELQRAGCLVHVNTNGSLLTDAMIDALLDLPLDSIKFSFQGVDAQSYREMRNTDFFDGLRGRVAELHRRRGDRPRPYLHVSTTITYETPEQVAAFRARFAPVADLVTVGRTLLEHIDLDAVKLPPEEKQRLAELREQQSVHKVHPECPEVFDKLSINWDGTVSACCWDYDHLMRIGDLNRQSLAEIWRAAPLERFRALLAEMRHDEIKLCRTCYDFRGLQTQQVP